MNIATRIDSERGCGWRVAGGNYLVTGTSFTGCDRMPLPLDRCPTCDHGVKPARGWTWIDADAVFASKPCQQQFPNCATCMLCAPHTVHRTRPCPQCKHDTQHNDESVYCSAPCNCTNCSTDNQPRNPHPCNCDRTAVDGFWTPGIGRVGLLWVGEKFYATPELFSAEAARLGISRRLQQIPREFVVGETLVLMAHRKAIKHDDGTHSSGIFMVTRPTAIEYVVKGDETEEKLESLVKRGITPVQVKRLEKQTAMFEDEVPV